MSHSILRRVSHLFLPINVGFRRNGALPRTRCIAVQLKFESCHVCRQLDDELQLMRQNVLPISIIVHRIENHVGEIGRVDVARVFGTFPSQTARERLDDAVQMRIGRQRGFTCKKPLIFSARERVRKKFAPIEMRTSHESLPILFLATHWYMPLWLLAALRMTSVTALAFVRFVYRWSTRFHEPSASKRIQRTRGGGFPRLVTHGRTRSPPARIISES